MPDTQVLRLPTDGPSRFPAPTPVHAYLTHLWYRSLTSLKLEASRHGLLGLPVCPCGFQIVLLHLFVFFFFSPSCFTPVFPSPPPALLTSDSSFSVRTTAIHQPLNHLPSRWKVTFLQKDSLFFITSGASLSLVKPCLIPSKFQKRICQCSWCWGWHSYSPDDLI